MDGQNPYSPPVTSVDPPAGASYQGLAVRYEPGAGRATASIVLLYIAAAVELLGALGSVYTIVIMGRVRQGGVTGADALALGVVGVGDAVLTLVVRIGCAIAFSMWFYRVYRNLLAFGFSTTYTPGWAPGSFYVPFLNLVRPYQIAREIWIICAPTVIEPAGPGVPSATGEVSSPQQGHGLVSGWWALFLGSNIVATIGSRMSGETPDSVQVMNGIFIVASLLSIGAAFACVKMINGIEERQAGCARQQQGPEAQDMYAR